MAQESDNIAHALAGAGGGLLSMTLTYPLITLSTRAQVESRRLNNAATPPSPAASSPPEEKSLPPPATNPKPKAPTATTTLSAARHILRREGVAGLYSGLSSALFGITLTNFIYYYFYEFARSLFLRAAAAKVNRVNKNRLSTVESMLAGALAGAMTVVCTNPIWVVNTRATTASSSEDGKKKKKGSKSTFAALAALLKEEGLAGLFKGVVPALVLVINPILQYTLFEQMRNALEKRRKVRASDVFLLGAVGKAVATGVTYPYITVKSRMHVAKDTDSKGWKAEGMGEGLRRVVREEGVGGLYKGIGPKVSQSVITAAFLFAFKDVLYEASLRARKALPKSVPVKS